MDSYLTGMLIKGGRVLSTGLPILLMLFLLGAVYGPAHSPARAACTTESSGADCIHSAISDANGGGNDTIKLTPAFGFTTLGQALNTLISIIFLVAGLLAFAFILLGAFTYLTAGEDSAKTQKARTQITNAIIGLILVAMVYVIWLVAINLIPGMSTFFGSGGAAGTDNPCGGGGAPGLCNPD